MAATAAFGVGSVGVLAAACCIHCSATKPGVETDADAKDLVATELPLELRETNGRLKSVLAALDPAAAIEPRVGGGLHSEDEPEDKQLRMALARVGTLEAELEQTQRSLQSALRHGAGRVRGAPADSAGLAASDPEHTTAADRANMSRLRYMALREGHLQMDRSVHVHNPHRVS